MNWCGDFGTHGACTSADAYALQIDGVCKMRETIGGDAVADGLWRAPSIEPRLCSTRATFLDMQLYAAQDRA
jgi:hypothetical protein